MKQLISSDNDQPTIIDTESPFLSLMIQYLPKQPKHIGAIQFRRFSIQDLQLPVPLTTVTIKCSLTVFGYDLPDFKFQFNAFDLLKGLKHLIHRIMKLTITLTKAIVEHLKHLAVSARVALKRMVQSLSVIATHSMKQLTEGETFKKMPAAVQGAIQSIQTLLLDWGGIQPIHPNTEIPKIAPPGFRLEPLDRVMIGVQTLAHIKPFKTETNSQALSTYCSAACARLPDCHAINYHYNSISQEQVKWRGCKLLSYSQVSDIVPRANRAGWVVYKRISAPEPETLLLQSALRSSAMFVSFKKMISQKPAEKSQWAIQETLRVMKFNFQVKQIKIEAKEFFHMKYFLV
jgi:hypothetical protein